VAGCALLPKREGLADDFVQFVSGGTAAGGERASEVFPVVQRKTVEVAGDADFEGGTGDSRARLCEVCCYRVRSASFPGANGLAHRCALKKFQNWR
jgi:hypothetical protein